MNFIPSRIGSCLTSCCRDQLQLEDASKETLRQKIVELETVLAGINGKVEEYDDALVRKLIERITV